MRIVITEFMDERAGVLGGFHAFGVRKSGGKM